MIIVVVEKTDFQVTWEALYRLNSDETLYPTLFVKYENNRIILLNHINRTSGTIPSDNKVRTFHLSSQVSRPAAIDWFQPLLGYFRTNLRFIFAILNIHCRLSIAIPKNRLLIPQAIDEISFQRRKIGTKHMNK